MCVSLIHVAPCVYYNTTSNNEHSFKEILNEFSGVLRTTNSIAYMYMYTL